MKELYKGNTYKVVRYQYISLRWLGIKDKYMVLEVRPDGLVLAEQQGIYCKIYTNLEEANQRAKELELVFGFDRYLAQK